MAKISIDVEEIKKGLRATALTARVQLTELAKKAQKDLTEKSQEFMKNPKVIELTKKVVSITEQIEKTVTKNAGQFVDQVKAQVNSKFDKKSPKGSDGVHKAEEFKAESSGPEKTESGAHETNSSAAAGASGAKKSSKKSKASI